MAGLRAFHFSYTGTEPAETYKFYKKHIRGFLRWHRGDAVTDSLPFAHGGAISETAESSSHGSECPSRRVVHKAVLVLLSRQFEVLQS